MEELNLVDVGPPQTRVPLSILLEGEEGDPLPVTVFKQSDRESKVSFAQSQYVIQPLGSKTFTPNSVYSGADVRYTG